MKTGKSFCVGLAVLGIFLCFTFNTAAGEGTGAYLKKSKTLMHDGIKRIIGTGTISRMICGEHDHAE